MDKITRKTGTWDGSLSMIAYAFISLDQAGKIELNTKEPKSQEILKAHWFSNANVKLYLKSLYVRDIHILLILLSL